MKRNSHAGFLQSGGLSLNMFTEDELYEIHLATLEVLEHTGVYFENEEAGEILAGRDPEKDYLLGNNRVGFTNFGEGISIVDINTGELRPTVKRDVEESAILVDYLKSTRLII